MATAPPAAPHRPDVLVVGAGVLGLSVAASAAAAGASVTVLEEGPGACCAASAAGFAWANARGAPRDPVTGLRRQALRRHLHDQPRADPWFHAVPVRDRRSRSQATDAGTGEAPEGWVDVPAYAAEQRRRLQAHGGRLRTGARVRGLLPGGVRDVTGAVRRADAVVVAAGAASAGLLRTAGLDLPAVGGSTGAWGFVVTVGLPGHGVEEVLLTDDLHVRPAGPDHVALQSLPLEAALAARGEPATPATTWPALRAAAGAVGLQLPERAPVVVRAAARPDTVDGLPAVGRVAPLTYLVLSHGGVTLAPLLGHLVAEELGGRRADDLEPFRPDRPPGPASSSHRPSEEHQP